MRLVECGVFLIFALPCDGFFCCLALFFKAFRRAQGRFLFCKIKNGLCTIDIQNFLWEN